VRFGIANDSGSRLLLWFVCEAGHRPVGHGTIEFDTLLSRWKTTHPDLRLQKKAECYLESYLAHRSQPIADEVAAASQNS
jgi:hypothetical protein